MMKQIILLFFTLCICFIMNAQSDLLAAHIGGDDEKKGTETFSIRVIPGDNVEELYIRLNQDLTDAPINFEIESPKGEILYQSKVTEKGVYINQYQYGQGLYYLRFLVNEEWIVQQVVFY